MADDSKPCFVFLGPPGSGKGTQAGILAEEASRPAISTGAMLRDAVAAGSELGARVEAVMASGALVDDALMAEVVRERLSADDTATGFFLDGYPRTDVQADHLATILEEVGARLAGVLYVEVPEAVLVARATARGRNDDRPEIIRHRLQVYRDETEPLVERYRSLGVLYTIDGDRPIEQVTASIRLVLDGEAA